MSDPMQTLNEQAAAAFLAERYSEARMAWERAVAVLGPDDDEQAPALYENLGLAYVYLGRPLPACRAFLRALQGQPTSRPQSLRFVVNALIGLYRFTDAQRYLADYEHTFGAHPDGWTQAGIDRLRAES